VAHHFVAPRTIGLARRKTVSITQAPTPPEAPHRYGEIFDRGYKHYDGPRRGRKGAITSLIGYSMKRAMGIRKSWTAKVLPFLLYVAVTIPLIIMIGISAIVPDLEFASYSGYLSGIFLTVGIFVGTAAPEMICVDRHERTLPLYFSRAIARFDYVTAKIIAMSLLTMTMTVIPSILLWLGRQLTAGGVGQAMRDNIGDLGRVVFVGVMTALVLSSLGLAISSFTNRKGIAITIIIISFVVLTAVANIGLEVLDEMEWSRYLLALHLPLLFLGLSSGAGGLFVRCLPRLHGRPDSLEHHYPSLALCASRRRVGCTFRLRISSQKIPGLISIDSHILLLHFGQITSARNVRIVGSSRGWQGCTPGNGNFRKRYRSSVPIFAVSVAIGCITRIRLLGGGSACVYPTGQRSDSACSTHFFSLSPTLFRQQSSHRIHLHPRRRFPSRRSIAATTRVLSAQLRERFPPTAHPPQTPGSASGPRTVQLIRAAPPTGRVCVVSRSPMAPPSLCRRMCQRWPARRRRDRTRSPRPASQGLSNSPSSTCQSHRRFPSSCQPRFQQKYQPQYQLLSQPRFRPRCRR
jgi:ABC-2 type transport system permease protein